MAGNFLLREKYWIFAVALVPLIAFTLWWGWYEHNAFNPPSQYVSLSSVCEVQKGADIEEFSQLRAGHPVTRSQRLVAGKRHLTTRLTPILQQSKQETVRGER
jgi:calcium permeable stress-gated cation channel